MDLIKEVAEIVGGLLGGFVLGVLGVLLFAFIGPSIGMFVVYLVDKGEDLAYYLKEKLGLY